MRQDKVSLAMLRILDAIFVAVAFWLAYQLRLALPEHLPLLGKLKKFGDDPVVLTESWQALAMIIVSWWILLNLTGVYSRASRTRLASLFFSLLKTNILGIFILGAAAFIFRLSSVSRLMILFFVVLNFSILFIEKWVVYWLLNRFAVTRQPLDHILIVGTNDQVNRFVQRLASRPEEAVRLVGLVSWSLADVGREIFGFPILGTVHHLDQILSSRAVDEVIVIQPGRKVDDLETVALLCEEVGIKTSIVANLFDLAISRTRFRYLAGVPMITYTTTPIDEWGLFFKRMLDLFASALGLLLLWPLFVVAAVLIKLDSPGPVFFTQTRSGLNGREFTLFKFRSMVPDAEEQQSQLATFNEMGGPTFKMTDDPRVTWIGKFIRKTSIDELPQLFNVLKGEMSLVGPRPPLPGEVAQYERWQRRRLSVRPGITCIWQVSGRNQIDFDEWMRLDLQYIDSWSFMLDIKILVRTLAAVLSTKGAS
ncbi:MAG: sugar transferase [Proteobacteria bacterium]|nr:sugar transferase [Pseudomonadota bacterium]